MCSDVDDAMAMCMSGLSIEEDDGDADAEVSDHKELLLSSDPDADGNEAQKAKDKGPWRKKCRRMRKGSRVWEKNRSNSEKKEKEQVMKHKGEGGKSLCMELEEVKACRDLGFHLDLEIPSPLSLSFSNSTLDTSSAATSPITNWRISSPGKFFFFFFIHQSTLHYICTLFLQVTTRLSLVIFKEYVLYVLLFTVFV